MTAWAARYRPPTCSTATSAVARQHQGLIAVALAFGGLRERAGIEERERLARQIHDGIAQELVALGFRVDRLKRLPDDELRPEIVQLRTEVSRILGDVRSHIGDLRLTVRPEGGLGAAITSQLQVFGAATGAAVTLRLSESSFRLPAHVETGLYRIFLDFVADARRAAQTEDIEVEVSLRTQAPDARMVLAAIRNHPAHRIRAVPSPSRFPGGRRHGHRFVVGHRDLRPPDCRARCVGGS